MRAAMHTLDINIDTSYEAVCPVGYSVIYVDPLLGISLPGCDRIGRPPSLTSAQLSTGLDVQGDNHQFLHCLGENTHHRRYGNESVSLPTNIHGIAIMIAW